MAARRPQALSAAAAGARRRRLAVQHEAEKPSVWEARLDRKERQLERELEAGASAPAVDGAAPPPLEDEAVAVGAASELAELMAAGALDPAALDEALVLEGLQHGGATPEAWAPPPPSPPPEAAAPAAVELSNAAKKKLGRRRRRRRARRMALPTRCPRSRTSSRRARENSAAAADEAAAAAAAEAASAAAAASAAEARAAEVLAAAAAGLTRSAPGATQRPRTAAPSGGSGDPAAGGAAQEYGFEPGVARGEPAVERAAAAARHAAAGRGPDVPPDDQRQVGGDGREARRQPHTRMAAHQKGIERRERERLEAEKERMAECTFAPSINPKSAAAAASGFEARGDGSAPDRLHHDADARAEQRERARMQSEAWEVAIHPFAPQINPTSAQLPVLSQGGGGAERPLHERIDEVTRRREQNVHALRMRVEAEGAATFAPHINPASQALAERRAAAGGSLTASSAGGGGAAERLAADADEKPAARRARAGAAARRGGGARSGRR